MLNFIQVNVVFHEDKKKLALSTFLNVPRFNLRIDHLTEVLKSTKDLEYHAK